MRREQAAVEHALQTIYHSGRPAPRPEFFLMPNPLKSSSGVRPNSATIEDNAFGDAGKAKVTAEMNQMLADLSQDGRIYSYDYNGSANSGREIELHGKRIVLHQLPVAVTQEKATAIMGKGKLIHPTDLVAEIAYVANRLGGSLYGKLLIDQNAPMVTDAHRAWEGVMNKRLGSGKGNTGSGVSEGYSTWPLKSALTMRDFMGNNWRELFATRYTYYEDLIRQEEVQLSQMIVNALTVEGEREKRTVGNQEEFLDRLEAARDTLRQYVMDVRYLLEDVWRNTRIPISFPAAQGDALDQQHGVYPDITASRPIGRVGIPDSTEGVVIYEEIAMPMATIKIPYMSSVGSRVHPYKMDKQIADLYQRANEEEGRSTKRKRGIYPIDLPVMQYTQRVAGHHYLAVTHLDAAYGHIPIEIVTHYVNKETGEVEPYRPHQWHWDQVEGVVTQLPSWNGQDVKDSRSIEELPTETLQFLELLSRVLAPVAIATNGREMGARIPFFK